MIYFAYQELVGGVVKMVVIQREEQLRAVVINIEVPYNAYVADEVVTTIDFLDEALEGYKDLKKFRIITV